MDGPATERVFGLSAEGVRAARNRDPAARECPDAGRSDSARQQGDWASEALGAVLDRVAVSHAEVGARFPLFADPDTGRWTTTGRGSWVGGFWAGLLWLRARHTGDERDRATAAECTARLAPWAEADTATRGLILWYGTALADNDPGADALRARAARACLRDYEPRIGLVPWGAALGGPRLLARADGVPGTVRLLATENPTAAASHLHTHLALCVRGADGPRPAWQWDAATGWQPCEDPPADWARGRAWLLLALADALLTSSADLRTQQAYEALELLLPRPGDPLVPPAHADHGDGPLDTSAAAITAVALWKLALLRDGRSGSYTERAVQTLRRLVSAHLADGRLLDGCYDAGRGTAVRHQLVWGDFFLAFGLAALTGLLDLTAV
ncbi:sugar ABC transporter permease [Streptomyces sp. NPDC048370]|uniref:sugar ABC transporter permease n=1 Tax=Streptomyces sp. NPDC048370 TaxID=3365540 RepID=UPI0037153B09